CGNIKCRHQAAMALAPLNIRWGPNTSSDMLRRSARCTRCGHKGATLQTASWGGSHTGFTSWPIADEASDPFEETMGVVERLAAKIVEMPLERRPEGFMVLREVLVEVAKEMNLAGTKLNEFVNHTLSAVETLVRM